MPMLLISEKKAKEVDLKINKISVHRDLGEKIYEEYIYIVFSNHIAIIPLILSIMSFSTMD